MQQRQSSERIDQNIPPRLAGLVRQFYRAVELRERRDTETLAGLVRALSNSHSPDAERLIELLQQKLTNKGTA
jgi:hypothetical protein